MNNILAFIKRQLCKVILYAFRMFPIDKQKYVFSSYFSTKYNDNPRAIFEAMRSMHPEKKYIWLLRDTSINIDDAIVINANSLKALYHLATAKCWIDNCRKRSWVVKRSQQKYVQTWHGGIALKRVEADVEDKLPHLYVKAAKRDSKMADVFLSGSKWQTESIKRSYWYDGTVLEFGLPRSDVFFNNKAITNINNTYQLKSDIRVLMYAPTFRADEDLDCYNMDYNAIIKTLRHKFGDEWIIFLRLHPNISYKSNEIHAENIIDVSSFQDINELIIRSDILITDYSSCMFDAMIAGKIVFIFATDIDKYSDDRGFEFSFDELPFDISKSNEELVNNIKYFNEEDYRTKIELFKNAVRIYENGDASNRVAKYIFENL